jgi:hypothetical protein
MGKKSSKRRKQGRTTIQPGETALPNLFDGMPHDDKSILSLMDNLFQSHAELCSALRLAGRQLLRVEQPGAESLEKIRTVLKRAANVRKALMGRTEGPETFEDMHKSAVASASDHNRNQIMDQARIPKSVQKGTNPGRRQSPVVIRFPGV